MRCDVCLFPICDEECIKGTVHDFLLFSSCSDLSFLFYGVTHRYQHSDSLKFELRNDGLLLNKSEAYCTNLLSLFTKYENIILVEWHTANVIPVKITDNPRTDSCTICVKCKYYRDYLYHDMSVIVI